MYKQCCGSRSGIRGFFDPLDPGWKKIQCQDPGTGMHIPDLISENSVSVFWVKIFAVNSLIRIRDPESCQPWIRDPRLEKNRIRVKHPGSATLSSNIYCTTVHTVASTVQSEFTANCVWIFGK
jgi:hypothetical protein